MESSVVRINESLQVVKNTNLHLNILLLYLHNYANINSIHR